jgi:hypothetical protein
VTEPDDVLFGRAEMERAFTALGERAPGLRASWYSNPFRVSVHGLPQASRLRLEHLA